ncbi:MAG TPA: sigma-70 family RNA polymerase sigma factor [Candidatus Dormibacteraeota bacterium]|nr:sigma-70 family RNA polymerase sigma factor [Candidatus Dormibacteraeota bacterium]
MAAVALCDRQPAVIRTRVTAVIATLEAPLIRRAQAGDSDAFGELYSRHEGRVRHYLASRLGGGHAADIDDLVAETFLVAMQRIAVFELDRPGEFGNWLVGIARNKLMSWLHRPSRRETASDEPWAAAGTAPESSSAEDVALDRMELAGALSRLAPRARRALVMQHAIGLPTAEIALALGTTKRSVWELTGMARAELRGQAKVCACGCGGAVPSERRYATQACYRQAIAARVLCACGCGIELPAQRRHNRRYATARCRSRAAWQRRKEAQRRFLAGSATNDPAVERVLALVQASGGNGIDRGELSRRTRVLAVRLDRALDLLARRHLVSVHLEPSEGRLLVRYRAPAASPAWRAAL